VIDKSDRYDKLFMDSAILSSNMSYCKRKKVGSVIVKDNRILVNSWNGTISGTDNCCEEDNLNGESSTKTTVVHAEANAILFAAKNGIKLEGCSLYVTLAPCIECSKMIAQSGIKEVIYLESYRCSKGLDFLSKYTNIKIRQFNLS
jgi:dCMP deaminase